MKKLLKSLALVVAAALMMTACGGGGGGATPSDVVKKFMEATTTDFDFAKAKQYVAKEHLASYDEVMALLETPEMKAYMDAAKAAAQAAGGQLVKIDVVNEEIDGDNAKVTVKMSSMGQEMEEVIPLIKEDGSWKINQRPNM